MTINVIQTEESHVSKCQEPECREEWEKQLQAWLNTPIEERQNNG